MANEDLVRKLKEYSSMEWTCRSVPILDAVERPDGTIDHVEYRWDAKTDPPRGAAAAALALRERGALEC